MRDYRLLFHFYVCAVIFVPIFFVTVSFQHKNFEENTIIIERADNEQVMMLVGGMEETEAMGPVSNVQNSSLILFPSGRSCMLKKPIFRHGTSSGFALFDGKTVAVCAGVNKQDYNNFAHNSKCQFWTKESGEVEVKDIKGDNSYDIKKYMMKYTTLNPIYASCSGNKAYQDCVLFLLNMHDDNDSYDDSGEKYASGVVAQLVNGNVYMRWISYFSVFQDFPFRSCLVYIPNPGNHFVLLGGGKYFINDQTVSMPINNSKIMKWSPFGVYLHTKFTDPKCPLVTKSVYSQCLAFKTKDEKKFHILMIGGEDGEDGDPGRGSIL